MSSPVSRDLRHRFYLAAATLYGYSRRGDNVCRMWPSVLLLHGIDASQATTHAINQQTCNIRMIDMKKSECKKKIEKDSHGCGGSSCLAEWCRHLPLPAAPKDVSKSFRCASTTSQGPPLSCRSWDRTATASTLTLQSLADPFKNQFQQQITNSCQIDFCRILNKEVPTIRGLYHHCRRWKNTEEVTFLVMCPIESRERRRWGRRASLGLVRSALSGCPCRSVAHGQGQSDVPRRRS